jgi:outer membrane immunogenic protein
MRANRINLRSVAAAAGLAAVFATGSAYAADVVYEEPPAPAAPMETPPVVTWAGPYAGISAGYGFGGSATGAAGGTITGANGWMFGGFAGYNWQSGGFVYGLEGDIGYNGQNAGNGTTYFRNGLEGSLRARFGYAPSDNLLLYATAGGAGSQQQIFDAAGAASGGAWGWTAGAGADVKMTEKTFARIEYRNTDLGNVTLNTGSGAQTINSQNHRIMVGLGVKF